jgi:hypothetical protein
MMNFERKFCYFRLTSIRFRGPDQLIKVISSPAEIQVRIQAKPRAVKRIHTDETEYYILSVSLSVSLSVHSPAALYKLIKAIAPPPEIHVRIQAKHLQLERKIFIDDTE